MDWLTLKSQLVEVTRLDKDALHIYAALLLQLGAAVLSRRTLAHWLPWIVVLAAELANEWYDVNAEIWPERDLQFARAAHDVVNTMLLPTLLMVLARVRPQLFGARGPDG